MKVRFLVVLQPIDSGNYTWAARRGAQFRPYSWRLQNPIKDRIEIKEKVYVESLFGSAIALILIAASVRFFAWSCFIMLRM